MFRLFIDCSFIMLKSNSNLHLTGLPDAALNQSPQDKHLVRLASRIGIASFKEFVIHLGLPKNAWDEIEYRYGKSDVKSMKCMALCEWRIQSEVGTFKDLQRAFLAIQDDRHHLCQVVSDMHFFLNTCLSLIF